MRVGVTGIFASGKGTVCELFAELGAEVIDTDIVAREIMEPGQEGLRALVEAFGDDFLDEEGRLKRREFGVYVFEDSERVELLNSITHPMILEEVQSRSSGEGVYMVNTPLLFESGYDRAMDKNIVVMAQESQVLLRGVARDGISKEEIISRLNYQIPLKEKKALADYIIDNSGSLENTRRQVRELWKILNQEILSQERKG